MKRIITCSDGTWNKPGVEDAGKIVETNVQKLFEAVCKRVDATPGKPEVHQIKYYDEGIGAEGTPWSKAIDGATGKGIDDNIKDIYKFIVWNYEPKDELFLFGFSRGAYTARSLAGMIRNCGILKNNDLDLINQAYDIYRDRDDPAKNPNGEVSKAFKKKYCYPEEQIKFVGVWDTVGALGIPVQAFQFLNKNKYSFHDTTLSGLVDNAYQALAIDERRNNFKPTLWTQNPKNEWQTLDQVWFTGVHSNIGGGYPDTGLSDITLKWMIDKAKKHGLGFDEPLLKTTLNPNALGTLYDSKTGIFKLTPDYLRPVLETEHADEQISSTVFDRINDAASAYKPKNIKLQASYGAADIVQM